MLIHDNSSRGNILRFPPVSPPASAHAQEHGFEKPVELCTFLIGKHSFAGELVVDLCGCTGGISLAAIEMNRQWVYVESHLTNVQIGACRLTERLRREHAEAS
jgi:DNA modification methylase